MRADNSALRMRVMDADVRTGEAYKCCGDDAVSAPATSPILPLQNQRRHSTANRKRSLDTRTTADHGKKEEATLVRTCSPISRTKQDCSAGNSKWRTEKMTEKEKMIEQHQGMDRPLLERPWRKQKI